MSNLETQMKHRDKEMVPTRLVTAMFALMAFSLAIVVFAKLTGQPQVGVLDAAPVEVEAEVVLVGDRGTYEVFDMEGTLLAMSDSPRGGFLGAMGRAIDRQRRVYGVAGNAPIKVMRRTDGTIAISDPETGMVIDLIGYGQDNVAAFAQFVN